MALQADVQYLNCPVDGTAARKVEHTQRMEAVPVYTRRRTERKVIAVDPVALCGIVLSAVMLISMVVGLFQYTSTLHQARQMNTYVQQLQQENLQLQQQYQDGYDIDEIMDIALEAGMVPVEELACVRIDMEAPQEEDTRMSFWETVTTFLTGIFA